MHVAYNPAEDDIKLFADYIISVASYYSICLESWNAGNVYVGKYSDLGDANRSYSSLLKAWLFYLEQHKHYGIDYFEEYDNEELMKEIMKYYV